MISIHLTGAMDKKSFDCNVKTLQCRVFDTPASTPELLRSPDGRWAALTSEDNLFVREMATGHERQLTTDGAPYYSWAMLPGNSFSTVVRRSRVGRHRFMRRTGHRTGAT